MKKYLLISLLCLQAVVHAQWSNTSNRFNDSLYMRVNPTQVSGKSQASPVVLRTYPDSGWVVVWEDVRAGNIDIYAQKLDKHGVQLWQANGVPVATGAANQQYSNWGNSEYRNYPVVCTDSANGFYITWYDPSVLGVCVQHIRANGTAAYGTAGFATFKYTTDIPATHANGQIVPDGKGGFFLGVGQYFNLGYQNFLLSAWRGGNAAPERYFYKRMDQDIAQGDYGPNPCTGDHNYYLLFTDDRVMDFYIYADGYNGCGAVWAFSRSGARPTGGLFVAYNHIIRARKNCLTTAYRRQGVVDDPGQTKAVFSQYQKDSLYQLYNFSSYSWNSSVTGCQVAQTRIENLGEGYQILDDQIFSPSLYDLYYIRAGVLQTPVPSNIMPQMAVINELFNTTQVGTTFTRGYFMDPVEKFDSIPYQLRTDTIFLYRAYNGNYPAGLKRINHARDTVLAAGTGNGSSMHDVTFTAGGNRAFIGTSLYNTDYNPNGTTHLLQEVRVDCTNNPDSFSIHINTASKQGLIIAKDVWTGFDETSIYYDYPHVAMDRKGNAAFFSSRGQDAVLVSPVGDSSALQWGPGGKPVGNHTAPLTSFMAMDADGTGVVAWQDGVPGDGTRSIYMRHIDSLDGYTTNSCAGHSYHYPLPFLKTVLPLPPGNNAYASQPYIMLGTTKQWNDFDIKAANGSFTTVAQVSDNVPLGYIYASAFENSGTLRTYNGKPYLDRNYQVTPANNLPAGAAVAVRLFFTSAQFNALKAADASIATPGDLIVIKQPTVDKYAPPVFTETANDVDIQPVSWAKVDSGYYIQVNVTAFSNFFIMKGANVLAASWLNVQASQLTANTAKISWQVANEQNVQSYTVQQSTDGIHFYDAGTVQPAGSLAYSHVVAISGQSGHYFRIEETSFDGRHSLSQIVLLGPANNDFVVAYPNPASDRIVVKSNEKIVQVMVYDAAGRMILHKTNNGNQVSVAVASLPAGTYTLKLFTSSGKAKNKKLVIVH